MTPVLAAFGATIFEEMSALARRTGAVNLGQGFPDGEGPLDVRRRAAEAVLSGPSQYPPMMGLPELRAAVSDHYARWYGQTFDPATDVLVTAGATEALAASILALAEPGSEVVLFEPAFDVYLPMILQAGAIPRRVRLQPPAFRLEPEALAEAVTERTSLVVLNTPHNPAGRVYGSDELAVLAGALAASRARVVSDEVWEHVIFDGRRHIPFASLPGMAERTVKVGSGGKIFSMTGWKVGWAVGPEALVRAVSRAHQFLVFTVAPATQAAIAYGLSKPEASFLETRREFERSRERLRSGLEAVGWRALPCEGTYFLNLDLAASGVDAEDVDFCRRACVEAGVAAIPVSAFYGAGAPRHLVRLCLAKRDETLDRGVEALGRARRLFAG